MMVSKPVLSALVLLALAAPVIADTYTQKVDCAPWADGCADAYGEYSPPDTDYITKRIGPGAGLGAVCIVICCFGFYLWCCCRCWAKLECCGLCKMGLCRCCCGAGTPITTTYTTGERCCMGISLILAICLCVFSAGIGISGGKKTYDGATDLLSQSLSAVTQMGDLNTKVAKKGFKALGQFYGPDAAYDDAAVTEAIDKVKDHINDFKKKMDDGRDFFDQGCWGLYGLFVVWPVLGLICWMCGCGVLSMIMGLGAMLLFFLTWFLFMIFYSSGVLMDDTCVALSDYYNLDCMVEPGKTCQQDKLTELFQCTDITTVSDYYTMAWNLIDSAEENGAGKNQYGTLGKMPNNGYKAATTSWANSAGVDNAIAPAGIGAAGTAFGMEPYTTCATGYTYSDVNGNRATTCASGATNTGIVGPQNLKLTTNQTVCPDVNGATDPTCGNPGWTAMTCAHACLNNSASGSASCTKTTCDGTFQSDGMGGTTCLNSGGQPATFTAGSGCVLDSMTNLGGNLMFRKFAYEMMTSTYVAGTQGYATCGEEIGWSQREGVVEPQKYQNYSSWMTTYNGQCVSANACQYTQSDGFSVIPYDATTNNPAACLQAAVLAATDIMYALSYIGSCEYVKTFALLTAVQSGGACFDLGDGLLFLFLAQGLVGFAYFIVVFVGIWGYRCFNSDRAEGATPAECDDPDHDPVPMANDEDSKHPGIEMDNSAGGGAQAQNTEPFPDSANGSNGPSGRDEWV